jgi:hypothetical protein
MVQIQGDTIVTSSDLPTLSDCEPRIQKVAKFGIIIEAERGFDLSSSRSLILSILAGARAMGKWHLIKSLHKKRPLPP